MVRWCLGVVSAHATPASFFTAEHASVPGLDTTVGVAHGQAGSVEFLRQLVRCSPSEDALRLFAARTAVLTQRASEFVDRAAEPNAVPLCTSWCRGLAGLGRVLLAVGRQLPDSSFVDLAAACAGGCLTWLRLSRLPLRCCCLSWATGTAGVLGFLTRLRDLPGVTPVGPF